MKNGDYIAEEGATILTQGSLIGIDEKQVISVIDGVIYIGPCTVIHDAVAFNGFNELS